MTKDKLIEKLRKWYLYYFRCAECALVNGAHELGAILKEAADYIESKDEQVWFPVSELPKERGRYLCYFKYEPESPDVICENTYYGSGYWMSEKDRVTHWAYLPKLPEGN